MATLPILPPDSDEVELKIVVNNVFNSQIVVDNSLAQKSRTVKPAKSLTEVYDLVRKAVEDYQKRANTPQQNQNAFTEGDPDLKVIENLNAQKKSGLISFGLVKRCPGAFSQGKPFEGDVKNMRPLFRESLPDPENPSYRLAHVGYWHDNIIRFTMWAQTNKRANEMALWFEDLMDEYDWFFKAEGCNRLMFWERKEDKTLDIDGNKWYGRPIDYFVRTEKIKIFSEKTIEQIVLNIVTKQE